MIYGLPDEFAVTYEVCESSEDEYWQYGIFNFVIDDVIVPAIGSNYTLHMVINHLKDSLVEFPLCKKIDTSLLSKNKEIMEFIAHSHNILLDTDDDGLEFPEMEQQGIDLTPVEFTDVGFYIFYYITSNSEDEFIIYTCDRGLTVAIKRLKKNTVKNVIEQLPRFKNI
ncbi:immunity 42 family protein [Photorhabdus luminescens]|uniref:Immunity protein 42 n=1 Tax=Photorhabdus luminescens subsp. sonorensis TaxID=1173677 RepID=A0A5C4RIB4_PHOLU|nr:immunity 42 family protein [Photorhabdus luminescens]TNH43822.1 hypothetical protein EP164_09780 [Photorhabdus luminescens subsp. sonorensis]